MIPAHLRPRLEFAAKSFLNVACLGVLVAGGLRLEQRVRSDPANRVDLGAWTLTDRPAWMGADDASLMRDASGLHGHWVSSRDRAAGEAISAALERAPTVERVLSVRRIAADRLECVLEVRPPVVAVRLPGTPARYVEIDGAGRVLGPAAVLPPERGGPALRVAVGCSVGPGSPEPGDLLGEDAVTAARLAGRLDAEEGTLPGIGLLREVDVTNLTGRVDPAAPEILLRAPAADPAAAGAFAGAGAGGCVVEWGRAAPDRRDSGARSFDGKVAHLRRVLARHPDFRGLATVKVAFADAVVIPAPPAGGTRVSPAVPR